MTDEEIHNIYLHMSGKAEGLVEATGTADFPVLFARAILEYEGLTKDVQNMASESTYKEQVETKDEPVAWMSEDEHTVYTSKQVDGCFQHDHIPLYTTPQTKEWVGLTNEDIENCFDESCHLKVVDPKGGIKGSVNIFEVGRAIVQLCKERNT